MSEAEQKESDAPRRGPRRGHGPARFSGEKAADFKGTMKKLIAFMAQFKGRLALVFVFAVGSTIFSIVGPKVLSEATTVLFEGVTAKIAGTGSIDFERIGVILITTLSLYVVSAVCSWVQSWEMSYISQRTCYLLRNALADKIERVPFGHFEKTSTGDTLSRITNDVDTLGQSLNQGITQIITSATTVIGVLIMMLSINWIMTLIALVTIPITLVLVALVVGRSQKYFRAQQALLGSINTQVEETFSGHTVVKAFGKEDETVRQFKEINGQLYEAGWKSQFISGLMMPIMGFVGNLTYVAVGVAGALFCGAGMITVGDIQAFIQYVKNFTQPLQQLAQVSNVLQSLAAAAERIFAFLDLPEMETQADDVDCAELSNDVRFDQVSFGYVPDKPVIKDFSASVQAGQTVAIVGPTGAGKTTLIKLLMRFYDADGGAIELGGMNIERLSRTAVRNRIGMVLQDTWLFSGTIRENIRYGRLTATDEEVEAAAKDACAHHFISTLPGGYDFVINEDATNISQGQRQLLTIARALLADRQMLILDEATSSVDTRTELHIQAAMDKLMENRTSFVIAHRLSTIRNADLILVMKEGDIVEQGSHEELLDQGGFYASLYESQFVDCIDRFDEEVTVS